MAGVESGYVRSTLSVVSALEAVVVRSFGPNGGVVLFTRDTGEVLLTRHGQKILNSLHLEHPIARMVVDCIQAHCSVAADGSKSFLLLLASLLRRIHAHSKACKEMSNARARHLANQLLRLCYDGLDDIIVHQVMPHASSLYSSGYRGDTLEGLVRGYMAGRVGIGQAEVLVPIICQFCRKWNVGQGMAEPIRFIHKNFPLLHSTVLGLPIGRSCVQEGFLLGCDWTMFFERKSEEPIRVLVLNESVFVVNEAVSVFENYVCDSHATVHRLCVCAEELDVCVLLSPVKCPDLLLQQAQQKRLCVAECVDPPLLDLFCQLSQSRPAPVGHVATVTSVSRVVLGGHRLGCVGLTPTHTSHSSSEHILHPHTLLLCAPGPGSLDQCVNACQGVFTMLRSVCEAERTPQNSLPDQSEETPLHPVQSQPSNDKSEPSIPAPAPTPDQWHRLLHAGHVVPVGGVFDVLFHHFLLSSDWVAEPQVRSLLAESVLSVPRTLHSHKPRLFMQFQASLLDELRSGPSLKPWSGGVESVSCKQQLLASVLQCVCTLLSVDRVLHTHSHSHITKTSRHGEDDED
ncbi:Bardet-Biedl syndrome 10 protein [Alosa sapidissima]|uniref:Bardet-Biedl syndrome 10 protein n=1 Tax=Alosa sapidissima TaxID=34773 RepID=UPI001C09EB68|nr:Bardet-Biedl syndrome 10 protein [Alosa sapidissima]XP_041965228.1 Bardet-Biedl syndrome 10 protein [Alosa sapidissima]